MDDFITLTCPTCGGKLQITNDIERFACGHCGNEHIVKRAGGIISLTPVIDAIHQVKTGVDKTAAELAIVRLQKELTELQTEKQRFLIQYHPPKISGFSIGSLSIGLLLLFATSLAFISGQYDQGTNSAFFIIGCILFLIGVFPFFLLSRNKREWKKLYESRLVAFDEQIVEKQVELRRNKNLVRN